MGHENSINRHIRKGRTDAKTKKLVLKLEKNVQMRGLTPSRPSGCHSFWRNDLYHPAFGGSFGVILLGAMRLKQDFKKESRRLALERYLQPGG